MPQLEIRIPISPNERYFRMTRVLVESLKCFGGPIARNAHVVLSVGADEEPRDLSPHFSWAEPGRLSIRWVDRQLFRETEYDGTGLDRYWVESNADLVAMMDADILIAGDFDDLLSRAFSQQLTLGFVAHVSPFQSGRSAQTSSSEWWKQVFATAGLECPGLGYQHTGWGLMSSLTEHRFCPYYLNYGFVVSPRWHVEQVARSLREDIEAVDRCLDTWFKSQIALTVSMYRHNLAFDTIGIRDNFPLHVDASRIRELNPDPDGLDADEDVRIFHYLGHGEVNKDHFDNVESFAKLLGRSQTTPAAGVFLNRLREVVRRSPGLA